MVARASAFRCAATSPMLWKKKLLRGELFESEEALMGLRPRLDDWFSRSSSAFLIGVHEIICAMPNAILAVNEAPPKFIVKTLYRELMCGNTAASPRTPEKRIAHWQLHANGEEVRTMLPAFLLHAKEISAFEHALSL
eukprot:5490102-Heterocapsa_arctica.AAC.1